MSQDPVLPSPPAPASDSAPAPARGVIPAWLRWLLIVVLPALGFLLGFFLAALVMDLSRMEVLPLAVLLLFAGAAGAFLLLFLGLTLAPIVPAGLASQPPADGEALAPARHPPGGRRILIGWLGGLVVGIPLGATTAFRERASSYYYDYRSDQLEAYTLPALLSLTLLAALIALLFARRRGPALSWPTPLPLHRAVLRALLRAVAAGLPTMPLMLLVEWAIDSRSLRGDGVAVLTLGTFLLVGGAAALLTLAEAVGPRLREPLRPWAPGLIGLVSPLPIALLVVYVVEMINRGDPLHAGDRALDATIGALADRPGKSLGLALSSALPFWLLCAARTGTLPYFGRRAPWPFLGQVPLALLAGSCGLAVFHLLVEPIRSHEAAQIAGGTLAGFFGLVVGLRLSEPLERRLVARWLLLTSHGD